MVKTEKTGPGEKIEKLLGQQITRNKFVWGVLLGSGSLSAAILTQGPKVVAEIDRALQFEEEIKLPHVLDAIVVLPVNRELNIRRKRNPQDPSERISPSTSLNVKLGNVSKINGVEVPGAYLTTLFVRNPQVEFYKKDNGLFGPQGYDPWLMVKAVAGKELLGLYINLDPEKTGEEIQIVNAATKERRLSDRQLKEIIWSSIKRKEAFQAEEIGQIAFKTYKETLPPDLK